MSSSKYYGPLLAILLCLAGASSASPGCWLHTVDSYWDGTVGCSHLGLESPRLRDLMNQAKEKARSEEGVKVSDFNTRVKELTLYVTNYTISKDAFSAYTNLRILDIRQHQDMMEDVSTSKSKPFVMIMDDAFRDLASLKELTIRVPSNLKEILKQLRGRLEYLRITDVDMNSQIDALSELIGLEKFHCFKCELDHFSARVFPGSASTLKSIELPLNHLRQIKRNHFQNFPNLERLDLFMNKIHSIDRGSFANLRKLKELRLLSNELFNLTKETFGANTNLEILNLHDNRITSIEANTFRNLRKLKRLYLSRNNISKLSPDILRPNMELELLDISNNPVSNLSGSDFSYLTKLNTLKLSE